MSIGSKNFNLPIQQLAFHKEQVEVNGVRFYCHEAYYGSQIMNGVDLKFKEIKGLDNKLNLIDFLNETQELIFATPSSFVSYSIHKRIYNQLFTLKGRVEILKAHYEKMNSREYLVWFEKQANDLFPLEENIKNKSTAVKTSQTKKKVKNQKVQVPKDGANIFQNIFGSMLGGQTKIQTSIQNETQDLNRTEQASTVKKVRFTNDEQIFCLKIYDYSKKILVYNNKVKINQNYEIVDIFLFYNSFKIVGYILRNKEEDSYSIHYHSIEEAIFLMTQNQKYTERSYSKIVSEKQINHLKFNQEINCYVFTSGSTINIIRLFDQGEQKLHHFKNEEEDSIYSFFKAIDVSSNKPHEGHRQNLFKLEVVEIMDHQQNIINIAIDDLYLILLTNKGIYCFSVYQMNNLIISYNFSAIDILDLEPVYVEFNRSNLLVTYRNSSIMSTYAIKNKSISLVGTTNLEINHCKQIIKIFTNNISNEIFCVTLFYELESKMNSIIKSRNILESHLEYVIKPSYIDVTVGYLGNSTKTEVKRLQINKQKFKKLHTSPWFSSYLFETDSTIESSGWKETFENKRCSVWHPTGIFLVVCFKQSFKIYVTTLEGLVNTYRGDNAKDIQAVAISPLGNHLAIAGLSSILIYDFYSCQKIQTITLPLGVQIQKLEYRCSVLLCYLKSKKLYIYSMVNGYKQIIIFNPKTYLVQSEDASTNLMNRLLSCTISQIIINSDNISQIFYDEILNYIIFSYKNWIYFWNCNTSNIVCSYQFQPISYIYYNKNLETIFLGTDNGEIISYQWPNKLTNFLLEHKKVKLHSKKIIDIKATSDLKELITISQDGSLTISYITLVQNLKRLEGLQILEHLSSNTNICFDILYRKGFYQYTHSQFSDKLDCLKDYEDEVLNMNFILPEERLKQKQLMLSEIDYKKSLLITSNNKQFDQLSQQTNSIRDSVAKTRDDLHQFELKKDKEIDELNKKLFNQYLNTYDRTRAAEISLQRQRQSYRKQLQSIQQEHFTQLQTQKQRYLLKLQQLENEYKTQSSNIKSFDFQELKEIEQQKSEFIEKNIELIVEVINDFNINNGILMCKNNNLQKQISQMKKKIEQNNYLYFQLDNNLNKMKEKEIDYQKIKQQSGFKLQKEDKVNLTQIQKKYVKQTQQLIQKDKEIDVKIFKFNKQKDILVHLARCLEDAQGRIDALVENWLRQKQFYQKQETKIDEITEKIKNLAENAHEKRKQKIKSKNNYQNAISQLVSILSQVNNFSNANQFITILDQKNLIDPNLQNKRISIEQEKQKMNEIVSTKIYNIRKTLNQRQTDKNWHTKRYRKATSNSKKYRKIMTDINDDGTTLNFLTKFLNDKEEQEMISKKEKKITFQLNSQQKMYARIKTEQVVYQNLRTKFNTQNEDLIDTYNTLSMQKRKLLLTTREHEKSLKGSPFKLRDINIKTKESIPTPFMQYVKNKSSLNKNMIAVPSSSFNY